MRPPPRNTTIGPQFSGDLLLVVTLLSNNRHLSYRFRRLLLLQFSSAWFLYVALSSLILPLRQPIRPFTTNKALSGPPLQRDKAPFPCVPPPSVGEFGGGLRRL